jgi:hypothetical protein
MSIDRRLDQVEERVRTQRSDGLNVASVNEDGTLNWRGRTVTREEFDAELEGLDTGRVIVLDR